MPTQIRGVTYYRTSEACRVIGISRSSLLRWVKNGALRDTGHKDIRGWRLFTESDIKRIEEIVNHVT
jgi:excisionase family DNA binding protein